MTLESFLAPTEYRFEDSDLLQLALSHRSYSQGNNNERLEFLGDSILNLVISSHIYRRFPDASEGELSRIRAALVKKPTLAKIAREINLGDYLHLGGGELKSGGYRRASILADGLEALIGAVYLDSNFITAKKIVLHLYRNQLQDLTDKVDRDPKTRLQEYLQARKMALPSYAVEQTTGKSHNQVFTVSCRLGELELQTRGKGSSRKQAEQQAAQQLLEKLDL